jgi:hypothetical protein
MNDDPRGRNYCDEYRPRIQAQLEKIAKFADTDRAVSDAEELEALEREIRQLTEHLGGLLVGYQLQQVLSSEALRAEEAALVRDWPKRLNSDGLVKVTIRTAQGLACEVQARYYRHKGRSGAKRGRGLYPGLVLLGIHNRCTPGLAGEVSQLSAILGSLEEARAVLSGRGVVLNIKTVRAVSYAYAERARRQQQLGVLAFEQTVAGRRVVISCDGGRVRLREPKRGRKTAKGRRRYQGAWREPKLIIIYVVDDTGRLEKHFAPLIDGLLKGPDAVFKLLRGYLTQLGIEQADQVLFVADGAPWIWNRVARLFAALGLRAEQCYELVDFYHAVEHLGKVAALRKSWSAKQRRRWIKRHRQLLLKGQIEQVVGGVCDICRGRNSKAIRTERNYFVKNIARMAYDKLKALKLPIGSGGVESAIRRVVNLRLKGPCIFWYRENAEAMLMLRAYYKAGRWNMLKTLANSPLALAAD